MHIYLDTTYTYAIHTYILRHTLHVVRNVPRCSPLTEDADEDNGNVGIADNGGDEEVVVVIESEGFLAIDRGGARANTER